MYMWVAPSVRRLNPACGGGRFKSGIMTFHDLSENASLDEVVPPSSESVVEVVEIVDVVECVRPRPEVDLPPGFVSLFPSVETLPPRRGSVSERVFCRLSEVSEVQVISSMSSESVSECIICLSFGCLSLARLRVRPMNRPESYMSHKKPTQCVFGITECLYIRNHMFGAACE